MISSQKLLNILTIVLTIVAVIMLGVFLQREFSSGRSLDVAQVADWRTFATGSTRLGPGSPKVVVTVFSDILCPHCGEVWKSTAEIMDKFPMQVTLVYRHYPLYARAPDAARAGICAHREQKFQALYNAYLALRDSLGIQGLAAREDTVGVSQHWAVLAKAVGIPDNSRFLTCMSDSSVANEVQVDIAAGNTLRVTVVPTILINDVRVNGNPGRKALDSLVQSALAKK